MKIMIRLSIFLTGAIFDVAFFTLYNFSNEAYNAELRYITFPQNFLYSKSDAVLRALLKVNTM